MSVTATPSERTADLVPAGSWEVDPSHSAIEFQIKHMMIATVKGRFTAFDGMLDAGTDGLLRARGTVQVASHETGDAKRDEHLRALDFFDATAHPEIMFASTEITALGDDGLAVAGQLTIKGIARPVKLTGTVEGLAVDPWGNERVALELSGAVDRRDFGLTWNKALETGAALVADQVRIEIDISAVKLAEQ